MISKRDRLKRKLKNNSIERKKKTNLSTVYEERDRLLKEHNLTYKEYLQSKHWKTLCGMHKKLYSNSYCFCCNSIENLEMHHTSYRTMMTLKGRNLVSVCRTCHQDIHNFSVKDNCDLKYATYNIWRNHKGEHRSTMN